MPSATTPLAHGPGRRRRGSPESEDLPVARHNRTPRGRRIRVQTSLRCRRSRARRTGRCARRHRHGAGRGQDEDHLGLDRGLGHGREPARSSRGRLAGRRVLLPRHDHRLRAVRGPGRALRRRRVERLGVQGQQRLAAGRRRRGHAEGRRPRALVPRRVRPHRRPADAVRQEGRPRLLRRRRVRRQRQDGRRARRHAPRGLQADGCGQERPGLPRAASGAARPRRLRRGRGRRGDGDVVGDARPRSARPLRRRGAGGADGDAGARPEDGRRDTLRRPFRPLDRRRRRRRRKAARLVLVRERDRGRPERGRVPAARRRRRVVGLPLLARPDARAGRRRRVPGAVPARVRRQARPRRGRGGAAWTRGRRSRTAARRGQAEAHRPCRLARPRRLCPHDRRQRTLPRESDERRDRLSHQRARRRAPGGRPEAREVALPGTAAVSPGPAVALLAALAAAALLADHALSVAALATLLLIVALRAPVARRWPYLFGTLMTAASVFVLTPFVASIGSHPLWTGPVVPVLGALDVTREELAEGLFQALRLAAVGLAFACYALLVDHDRLVGAAGWARRSTLAVALATRLVPTLERDAAGLREALRGRGVDIHPARLLSPLLAGSLERGLNLAEAMEARGYGRPGRTRAPRAAWTARDRGTLVLAVAVVIVGASWL